MITSWKNQLTKEALLPIYLYSKDVQLSADEGANVVDKMNDCLQVLLSEADVETSSMCRDEAQELSDTQVLLFIVVSGTQSTFDILLCVKLSRFQINKNES